MSPEPNSFSDLTFSEHSAEIIAFKNFQASNSERLIVLCTSSKQIFQSVQTCICVSNMYVDLKKVHGYVSYHHSTSSYYYFKSGH